LRAHREHGPTATPLDYVVAYVAGGGQFVELAKELPVEMGEPLSRRFLSLIAHRLAPGAGARIVAARGSSAEPREAARCVHRQNAA
jgi:hypothetical protein